MLLTKLVGELAPQASRLTQMRSEYKSLSQQRDELLKSRADLIEERNSLGELRYRFEHERDLMRAECDRLRQELVRTRETVERADAPPPLIIFQHLAKTGGTSFGSILTRNLPFDHQLQIVPGNNISVLGTWSDEAVSKALQNNQKRDPNTIRYLGGHVKFGTHRFFSPRLTKYVTLLRDPVDRLLSGFYYSIERHVANGNEQVTLEDYVFRKRHYDLGLNNYQTRLISGITDIDPFGQVTTENARPITDQDFAVAVKHLKDHYLLAGITERFDEFLVILARRLGWSLADITYVKSNVTSNRPKASDMSASIRAEIEKQNAFDRKLYQLAIELFEKQIYQYGEEFQAHVQLFRQLNEAREDAM